MEFNYKKNTVEAFCILALCVGVPVFSGVSYYLLCLEFSGFWVLYPLMLFFLGTRFRALNNASHECCHGSFCVVRQLNDFFGEVFAVFELSSFAVVRREHLTHHRYLGDLEKDLDLSGLASYGLERYLNRNILFEHLRRALLLDGLRLPVSLCFFDLCSPLWAKICRFFFVFMLMGLAISFPVFFGLLVFLPYFYAFQIHKYLMDVIDHGGLIGNVSKYDKTRNFLVSNKFMSWLFLPRNDGYHLVHHLYPSLSVEVLPKMHKLLLERERYRQLSHGAVECLRKWWVRV